MPTLRLKPMVGRTPQETALRLYGRMLFLRHRPNDVRALMRALLCSSPLCIVLPADAPWSWLEFWAEQTSALDGDRLFVRFAPADAGIAKRAPDAR